jgi:arginine exporter protein ArgO
MLTFICVLAVVLCTVCVVVLAIIIGLLGGGLLAVATPIILDVVLCAIVIKLVMFIRSRNKLKREVKATEM